MLSDVEAVKTMLEKYPNDFMKTAFKKRAMRVPMAWEEKTQTWTTDKDSVLRIIGQKAPYPYNESISKMRTIYRCLPIFIEKVKP